MSVPYRPPHRGAIVMTGVTTGIGRAAVDAILHAREAPPPALLCLGARTPAPLAAALAPLAEQAGVTLVVLPLDLDALASVRDFAHAVRHALGTREITALVANAGLQTTDRLLRSADGHERTFAVNHLAHFALYHLLRDRLATGARVIVTGSGTHSPDDVGARRFGFRGARYTSAAQLARGEVEPGTSPRQAGRDRYATSKLCLMLFVAELTRRDAPAIVPLVYDPGLVPGTGLVREAPSVVRWAWRTVLPVLARLMPGASTAARSGATLAWLATAPDLAIASGACVQFDRTPGDRWSGADRRDWAEELWHTSMALTAVAPTATHANG